MTIFRIQVVTIILMLDLVMILSSGTQEVTPYTAAMATINCMLMTEMIFYMEEMATTL